jgi:hypothetical protein
MGDWNRLECLNEAANDSRVLSEERGRLAWRPRGDRDHGIPGPQHSGEASPGLRKGEIDLLPSDAQNRCVFRLQSPHERAADEAAGPNYNYALWEAGRIVEVLQHQEVASSRGVIAGRPSVW